MDRGKAALVLELSSYPGGSNLRRQYNNLDEMVGPEFQKGQLAGKIDNSQTKYSGCVRQGNN